MDTGSLQLQGVRYAYPSSPGWTVDVDLHVAPGEVVLLTGPTGCGKSTVLRLAAGLLQRHGQGRFDGRIRVGGRDPATTAPGVRVRDVGFVAQVPGDQVLTGTVAAELAFGMQSAGITDVAERSSEVQAAMGLATVGPERATTELSGGQLQRLITGASIAAGAGVLLLDEPIAQLDPPGALALLQRIRALADRGLAVLLVEHRLVAAAPFCDRVVVMRAGRVAHEAPAAELKPGTPVGALCAELGLAVPGLPEPPPLGAAEPGEPLLVARGLRWAWPEGPTALDGVDLTLARGERVAVVGPNGSGKTTLLRALAGDIDAGDVACSVRRVAVPQDPDLSLYRPTVRDELADGPREQGLSDVPAHVAAAARALSLDALLDRPPQALSRGQRLRTAVAAALACRPGVLLLDEPTAGQDRSQVEGMMQALSERMRDGALVFATHDEALVRRFATRVVTLQPESAVDPAPLAAQEHGGLDPRTRVALVMAVGVLAVTLERPAALALLAVVSAAPLLALRLDAVWWRRGALAVVAVVWSTVVSQGLFYAGQPRVEWMSLGPLVLWREGVAYGLAQSLRLVAVTLAAVGLAVSTGPDRLLAGLRGWGLPFGLALMSATALRFVPVVGREVLSVRAARAQRGRPVWRRSPWAWLALEVSLLRPVVARAWRRAQNLAEALDARGFDPTVPRAVEQRLGWRDGWALAGAGVLCLGAGGARVLYLLYTADAVYVPALRPVYGFVRAWL